MKDTKSLLLILVSFLLFVVSFTLLWTWGYRFYIKSPTEKITTGTVHETQPLSITGTRDSLRTVYSAAVRNLDNRFDSTWKNADSLKDRLDLRLGEFYRLRKEIEVLLKNQGSEIDLNLASHKIMELQQRVKDLLNKNLDVEYENKKLATALDQLKMSGNNPVVIQQPASYNNRVAEEKNKPEEFFTISDLRLTAMMNNADKEVETYLAQETEKLVGSFFIRNNAGLKSDAELVIVVLQPDGGVMKNSAWESGTFFTADGRKVYSCKLQLDDKAGEVKRLAFSLNADKYQKGNYTLQVYHKGMLIGKLQKILS